MPKEIWLGPVLGTNRASLLARCAEYVAKGETDRLLYIAASHSLLDLATQKTLDGKNARGVWGEFPFYLFRGFVRRVLNSAVDPLSPNTLPDGRVSAVLTPRVPIDREELPLRHSLISQIIRQLADAGKLGAIKRLANRDGCVNTIANLIGELQRAGKTAEEFAAIVESRAAEFEVRSPDLRFQIPDSKVQIPDSKVQSPDSKVQSPKAKGQSPKSQTDFDRDVALIYSTYSGGLDRFDLTDEDADQLRALQVLRGDSGTERVSLPWLERVELLVLDGFFDFTPVQGEMLRRLIPQIPNVIVNINHDRRNEQIFQPFQSTIEYLESISNFEVVRNDDCSTVSSGLVPLRGRLFNADEDAGKMPATRTQDACAPNADEDAGRMPATRTQDACAPNADEDAGKMPATRTQDACAPSALQLFECSDRETELRAIAKEIKRLIIEENYKLSDIALVLRERAAYADAILRVFAAESVPCNLERRVAADDIPCVRATAKLFQILREPEREQVINPKASDLAHLIKTNYFRLSESELQELTRTFDLQYQALVDVSGEDERNANRRLALGIGRWSPDVIENVIAYVGSELRVRGWLDRASRLIQVLPSRDAARSFIGGSDRNGGDAGALLEPELPAPDEPAPKEKPKRPSPVHPASIGWTMLVIEHLRQTIAEIPEQGTPSDLRAALKSLLEDFEFPRQVERPLMSAQPATDVAHVMVNVRGLEGLRRALAATVRSFNYASSIVAETRPSGRVASATAPSLTVGFPTQVALPVFIDELERCLRSQTLSVTAGDRDGLRVLEASDVRGLRFRAVFIAAMNEGSFPLRASRDWLYPHEERERLKKSGIVLEDISTETLLKEEHYFYQCACRATDRLYLTRPLAADDGIETVASYYIEELRRAIAPAQLDSKQIRSDIDRHEVRSISSTTELATKLIRQNTQGQRRRNEALLAPVVAAELVERARGEMYLSDSVLRRVRIELQRGGDAFGPYDGEITEANLRAMLATRFAEDYVHSASGLSAYGNCAFRFFAARVLRLEPRNEAALDLPAIDAGKLLHDILRRFFEQHRREYLPGANREELLKEMSAVADAVFKEHQRLVPPLNERIWKIDCEIRKLILEQVLLHELRLQEKTQGRGMLPAYFELAFGRASEGSDPNSTTEFLKVFRGSDETSEAALIQGQIDRVDLGESGKQVVAYDYKLSQGARIIDMRAGRQMQIPIYLAALEQLFLPNAELAGGGYYRLRGRGKRLNQGLYRKMFSDCTDVSSRTAIVDDVQWQRLRREISARVWQFIDAMRAGDFRVRPSEGKKTCKFCDYSAVCRYDPYRINRKRN